MIILNILSKYFGYFKIVVCGYTSMKPKILYSLLFCCCSPQFRIQRDEKQIKKREDVRKNAAKNIENVVRSEGTPIH